MFDAKRMSHTLVTWATALRAICCWIIFSPLLLVPRNRKLVVVIGREDGKFLDNAKYFFLTATEILKSNTRVVLVTEREDVVNLLTNSGYAASHFPSISCIWLLLRAGTVIVDSVDWTRHGRCYLLLGAKSIQLWHGVGYKRIELDLWRHTIRDSRWLSRASRFRLHKTMAFVTARLFIYDVFFSPSIFYQENVFKKAFLSRRFLICGYPRNVFTKIPDNIRDAVWLNVDSAISAKISDWIARGKRLILIAPTFRDSGKSAMELTSDIATMLDTWCEENEAEFIFKLHPFDRNMAHIHGRHLHLCDSNSDPYPLMPLSSALITDHSSIFMDYLHLDKPILFLRTYAADDEREFQFDPAEMTPGAKASSWASLIKHLDVELIHDNYRAMRASLKRLTFDAIPQELAVESIIEFMRSERWIPTA